MNMNVAQVNGTPVEQPVSVKVDTRIEQYVQLRDKIKEIEERQSKELKPYKETLEQLNGWLLSYLESTGSDSIKTKGGTVYSSTRYTASLSDPDAFMRFVISNEQYDLLDRRANATAVRDYIEAKGNQPPGVNLNGIKTVGVRRAPGK